MKRTILALAALWIFGWPAPVSVPPADSGQVQKPPASLQYDVTVALKLVQVHVTDRKGKPALDLEPPDFAIYDNGRRQTITAFEKHFLSVPVDLLVPSPEGKLQETRTMPARDISSLMNRKFIILIDYGHNDLEGIAKSKNTAFEFMDTQLQPGDAVALFTTTPMSPLTMHEYLTTDQRKVRDAIVRLKEVPGIVDWGGISLGGSAEVLGMEKMTQEMKARDAAGEPLQTRGLFASLTELAKALRQIPGQKNIILFSRGFGRNVMNIGSPERDSYLSMGAELASANSPIFAVNTAPRVAMIDPPETSLEYLSKLTGGKYFASVDVKTQIIKDIQTATGNYYVLGYTIGAAWDGEFHDVKVEVKRPGYAVAAQKGYFNPRLFSTLSPLEKHLHLLNLALGEKAYSGAQMDFALLALPFAGPGGRNTILLAELPVAEMSAGIGGNVELISLTFDPYKTIVDSKRLEIDFSKIGGEKVYEYTTAALAPGRYDCRVVLRNMANGKAAVGACSLTLTEAPAGSLRLFPPLLLVPSPVDSYLNASDPGKEEGGFSLFQVYPFSPKTYAPLLGELNQGTSLLYAMLKCLPGGAGKGLPAIEISAWLVGEDGKQKYPLAQNILEVMDQGEASIGLLELELPRLPPGRYGLHFLVKERVSGSSAETATDLRIR